MQGRVQPIDFSTFLTRADEFDALALPSSEIDGFCSSSRWVVPAHQTFQAGYTARIWSGDSGFAAFSRFEHPEVGPCLVPLESTWGLASPLILSDVRDGVRAFADAIEAAHDWNMLLVAGLEPSSALFGAFATTFGRRFMLRRVSITRRVIASLAGGFDGFLGRRTRKFRANVRRAEERGREGGVRFERIGLDSPEQVEQMYPGVMAIEATSWKSLAGEGVDRDPMRSFILNVLQRSSSRDDVRLIVASVGDQPVGYLHGALTHRSFRGLQMSFDAALPHLSLGNLLQLEMLKWLTEADAASSYDLGSELAYKFDWGEHVFETWSTLTSRQ